MKVVGINKEQTIIQGLVERCLEGSELDQFHLYKHLFGFSMHIANRYTNSSQDARAIVNESFLKIFQNLNQFDLSKDIKPWISRIIVNTSIDFLRKEKRSTLFQAEEIDDYAELSNLPEKVVDDELSNLESILPILRKLSPQYKLVFNLYVFEDYSHKEIAEKLDITVSTSKTNYLRAKIILKEEIMKNAQLSFKNNKNG